MGGDWVDAIAAAAAVAYRWTGGGGTLLAEDGATTGTEVGAGTEEGAVALVVDALAVAKDSYVHLEIQWQMSYLHFVPELVVAEAVLLAADDLLDFAGDAATIRSSWSLLGRLTLDGTGSSS